MATLRRSTVLVVALVLAAGACTSGSDASSGVATTAAGGRATSTTEPEVAAGTTAPTTADEGLGEGFAPARGGRKALRGFSEVAVTITDASGETCQACLLAATTEEQRRRGLMEVTDRELGGYDGMLFEFAAPQDGAFWMRNTPMPLSIGYFDTARKLVSRVDMQPCSDSPSCESYPAGGRFQYALEVPQGRLDPLLVAPGSSFTIDATECPLATVES